MFAFFNRSRRHVAVLAALAMLASVLVAAPAVAAEDPPEPSYTATFDACADAPSSGFTDVLAGNSNAGDIDCVAYYGITKGTSATTYSPKMRVTREHMALFLTRLAGRVGIPMVSDPDDAGFTDTGELSPTSQTAINQLAGLEITKGTSETTYSPADSVTRGQMALFIARLMDQMVVMTDGTDDYGTIPSDVDGDDVLSPFRDLGPATKSAYDAITALYELGVASGITDTAFAPSALITRAAMAEFMAGVLDHSNARPAGVTIQVSPASGWAEAENVAGTADVDENAVSGTYVVSVRDDNFMPVVDQAVDIFEGAEALNDDGTCVSTADGTCIWSDNDSNVTDENGNIVEEAGAEYDTTNVYYAWIGEENGDTFDSDDVVYVSASITAKKAEANLSAKLSANDRSDADAPENVDLDKVSSVTITVQLVDAGDADVVRSGIEIMVGVSRPGFTNTDIATLTTNDDGQVTYVVEGPEDDDDEDDDVNVATTLENRLDTIMFTYMGGQTVDTGNDTTDQRLDVQIQWSEDASATTNGSSEAPLYVVPNKDHDVTITGSVTLYDQFGNRYREGPVPQRVEITIGEADGNTDNPPAANANVNRNGIAGRTRTIDFDENTSGAQITVSYDTSITDITDTELTKQVQVVRVADGDSARRTEETVWIVQADENKFLVDDDETEDNAEIVFSYDSDDIFIDSDGEVISMEDFEKAIGAGLTRTDLPGTGGNTESQDAMVDVVTYDEDGISIFRVTQNARKGPAPIEG